MTRLLAILLLCHAAGLAQNFKDVRPSPQQLAWQDLEIGVLIHFGPNSFMDREWGDGAADASVFNPQQLDAGQWVKAAKAAGARYLIMVAKHHDGFCLWPSRHTSYSVKSSPWKEGKGDVVHEVAEACRRHNLKFGVYLSPWDRHEPAYADQKKYDIYYANQLTELATRYGPLTEFWLDGAGSEGHVYDFVRYVRHMRTYQPNALLFASLDFMPLSDIRWVGNEDGTAHEDNWNVLDSYGALNWRPAEADTPLRDGHWFWHPNSEAKLKSLDKLMDTYAKTVGRGAQLVLGLAPDSRGLLPDNDVKRLEEFGAKLKSVYGASLASRANNGLSVDLKPGTAIDRVVLAEDLSEGQNVRSFEVRVRSGGAWKTVAAGTTIGHKRIVAFDPTKADAVSVIITGRLAPVHLLPMTVHSSR